jgi:MoaA/NifB/PqqE/SkfB family radical SAM enzyme
MAESRALDPTRPPLPNILQVEVTGACNLRCRMCIVRYRPALARSASMSFPQFQRLFDALPDVKEVRLQGIGEPLMAPDIYRMVAYATTRGASAGFNTNGTLLTRRNAERLIDAGLDWLCISLDGASKETYEYVRDRANWDVVERNIEGLVSLLHTRAVARPRLSLVMVLMRRNLHDLPALVARAAQWGIPRIFVQGLSHDFSDAPESAYAAIAQYVEQESVERDPPGEVEAVFDEARTLASRQGIDLRLPTLAERTEPPRVGGVPVGCDWPWAGTYATYDGTIKPCCMVMGSERAGMGSLKQASLLDIWEGEDLRRFRAGLLPGGTPDPVCRGCALYRGMF